MEIILNLNNNFRLRKLFILIIPFLLQCNFGICQEGNFVGLSYSNYSYINTKAESMTDSYELDKHYTSFELNYLYKPKIRYFALSSSLIYSPFSYVHWQYPDARWHPVPPPAPIVHWYEYTNKIKSQNLTFASYASFISEGSIFKTFISLGTECESSLHSTSEKYEYLTYAHFDSTASLWVSDSSGYYLTEKTFGRYSSNYLAIGIQTGFIAKVYRNFYLSATISLKVFRQNNLLPLLPSGGILSYRFGLYYKLPSKVKEPSTDY